MAPLLRKLVAVAVAAVGVGAIAISWCLPKELATIATLVVGIVIGVYLKKLRDRL